MNPLDKLNTEIGKKLENIGTLTTQIASGEIGNFEQFKKQIVTENGDLLEDNNEENTMNPTTLIKDNNLNESEMLDTMLEWKQVFHLQDSFNKILFPNWRTDNLNWARAIRAELFETIDSFNWEWWKVKPNDLQNAEVELVDTFHFLISHILSSTNKNKEINIVAEYTFALAYAKEIEYLRAPQQFNPEAFYEKCELLMSQSLMTNQQSLMILTFTELWLSLGLTIIDLIKLYRAKNILNEFRQHNGYKKGNYIKIWGEEEDNVICWRIAKQLNYKDGSQFRETLYTKLEETYKMFN
jgi:hypothetical protein